LDSTLTDVIARLRQGRFPSGCHSEPVEESPSFTARKSRVGRDAADVCGKYRSRNRRSQTKCRTSGARCHGSRFRSNLSPIIPEAWRELVEKGDKLLVDLLASAADILRRPELQR